MKNVFKQVFFANLRGDGGIPFILMFMVLLTAMSWFMVGGMPKFKPVSQDAEQYEIPKNEKAPKKNNSSMQMRVIAAKKKEPKKVRKTQPPQNNNGETPNDQVENPTDGTRPTATPTKSTTPTGTQPDSCSQIAVSFLVDMSSSMEGAKTTQTRSAIAKFADPLPDPAAFNLITFGEPPTEPKERVQFNLNGLIRNQIAAETSKLAPNPADDSAATYMRAGFAESQKRIAAARSRYPNYKFYLIFISDGVPELDVCRASSTVDGNCDGSRNYDLSQDPTNTKYGPNIPEEIKRSGVTIYSIGIFTEADQQVNGQLETLLKKIASSSSTYQKLTNPSQMTSVLNQISSNICKRS